MGDSGPHRSDHYSPYAPSTSSYRGDWRYEPPRAPRWPQQDWRDRQASSSRDAPYGSVAPDYGDRRDRSGQHDSPSASSSSYRGPGPAPRLAPRLAPRPGPPPARPGLPPRPPASVPAPAAAPVRFPVHVLPPKPKPKAKAAAKPVAPPPVAAPIMRAEDHQPNAEGRSRLQRDRVPTAPPMILPTKRPPPTPLRPPVDGKRLPSGPSCQSPARGRGNANSRPIAPPGRSAMESHARPPPLPAPSTSLQHATPKEKPRAAHQLFPWERPSEAAAEGEAEQSTQPVPSVPGEPKKRAPRSARVAPHSHLTKPGGDDGPEEEVLPLEEVMPWEGAELRELDKAQDKTPLREPVDREGKSATHKKDVEKVNEPSPAGKPPKKTKGQKKAEKRAAAAAAAAESASSINAGSPHQAAFTSSESDDWQPVTPPLSKLPRARGIQVFTSPLSLSNGTQPPRSEPGSSSDGPTKVEYRTARKAAQERRKENAARKAAARGDEVDLPLAKKAKRQGQALQGSQSPESLRREERLAAFTSMRSDPAPPSVPQEEAAVKSDVAEVLQNHDELDTGPSSSVRKSDERPTLVLSLREDGLDTTGVRSASPAVTIEQALPRSPSPTAPDVEAMSLEAGSQQRQMSVSSDDIPLIATLSKAAAGRSSETPPARKMESETGRYRGTSFGPARRRHAESTSDTSTSVLRLSSTAEKFDMTGKRQAHLGWRWKWMAMLECQSSLPKNSNAAAAPSSALLAITPKGKTSLRFLSEGTASPACSHDLSFPSEMNIEAVRRVSSHAVAVASSSNNRVGEGGPQVSLVFAKDGKKPVGESKTDDDIEMSKLTARASAIHLQQRPHITGATSIAPFLPLGDQDALTMVTGGADGAVFAWSYSGSHAKSTKTTRLHALHSGTITALETLPKLDLVVSASTVHQHRAGGATQLVAFDARETKLLHSWKSSDVVAHLSRTTHSRLLDVSLLRADYDQHKLYDLRVPTSSSSGSTSTSASVVSSTRSNPTKPILSFGWASEYDLPFLGRPAFKNNYCLQGCPDGKVRTWDLRWASEVLQEVSVGEKGMPVSDVLLWDRGKEHARRGADDSGGGGGGSGTSVMALSPDAAWRILLI